MKIRNGFVSNSSSSSFVLMIEKGAHQQAMDKMKDHPQFHVLQDIAKAMEENKEKFLGRDIVIYEESDCHGEMWVCGVGCSYDCDPDIFNEDGEIEVFDEYLNHIDSDMRFSHSVDM